MIAPDSPEANHVEANHAESEGDALATPAAVEVLVENVRSRKPLGAAVAASQFVRRADATGSPMYRNVVEKSNIDFNVERLAFADTQTMDPRILRIAPLRNNERHRHAHESLFVVLAGAGEVRVGSEWVAVRVGDIAFVPRWATHQTRNTSETDELVVLAVTDFGFTSAVLGDYDRRTRMKEGGDDALDADG